MTFRQGNSSSSDRYSKPKSRLNQQIRSESTDEGCPVMEESGTICGETDTFDVFQEFRNIYEDCIKKLEGTEDGNATLRRLAPFKKLIDDLWEQNTMLVETVEELEQEATCRVTNLQDKLNKSCQKELHCMLKAKEREVESLMKSLSEKDELLRKYCCQIEEMKKDLKNKSKKYQEIVKQLKAARNEEDKHEENSCDTEDIQELLNAAVKNFEDQRKAIAHQLQNAESQIKALTAENKIYLKEKNEIANQCQCFRMENERLIREITSQKKVDMEKEELLKTIDVLRSEKNELLQKVNTLHENIQELDTTFKETRWALTTEVADKHDQVQDLKRCVGVLEDQLRQADMQTHFKDDIIKELRKELKVSRKSERRGLYDVVNELRERKNKSNVKSPKSAEVNKQQPCGSSFSDTGYHSTSSLVEKQNAKDASSITKPNLKRYQATLMCTLNKVEEMLRTMSVKHTCGLSNCKAMLEVEMDRIRSVKNDLQNQMKNLEKDSEGSKSSPLGVKNNESKESQCNLIHIKDVEKFKEKFVTGAVTLEQMKEQVQVLEKIIKQYINEFPCGCDKTVVQKCEDRLEKLHMDYDEISTQLHSMLQKLYQMSGEENCDNLSLDDTIGSREGDCDSAQNSFFLNISDKKSEVQKLQKQICDQENEAEKLKKMSKQLDEEIQEKRRQLMEQNREIDSKLSEICRVREIIRKVQFRLKEMQSDQTAGYSEVSDNSPPAKSTSNLSGLFCDLQKLSCTLEKILVTMSDSPEKLKEDNERLKEKLECLEKCICNKEETLRLLQDTVKLRECQIEELKFKMQTSESHSSKLAQDVEEKCRLIAKLQEAVRQCKQFEENIELIESLRFECCDLNFQLEKYEKEIILKDKKLEILNNELTELTSKNSLLTEKIQILDPKLKIMYKTCHLFEKTVNELQQELNNRECEIETLYAKIKDLEGELNAEFRKCEDRAADDSKYIEELSVAINNFQKELHSAQDQYNTSLIERENILRKEFETKETELNKEICRLKAELKKMKNQAQNSCAKTRDSVISNDVSRQEMYQEKITELEDMLEKITEEYDNERKNIIQKLCDEKQENLKNKNLITKLNDQIRRKILQEKKIKECIEHCSEDIKNLQAENQDLKNEVEARKKIMCNIEQENGADLTEFEELICSLKIQKADLKTKCSNLKAEVEKEIKLKQFLESRVKHLDSILQCKMEEFSQIVENYKCTSLKIRETCERMRKIEESLICSQNTSPNSSCSNAAEDFKTLKKLLDVKTSENAKLICQTEVLKVEIESIQNESSLVQATKDANISHLEQEIECLGVNFEELQIKYQKVEEENKKLRSELEYWMNKGTVMQKLYKEKQKDISVKLKSTLTEKNKLLESVDDLQKQLDQVCEENLNKEKMNRELSEECSRLKINSSNESSDNCMRNKSVKIICNLSKEVSLNQIQNLHCELNTAKENFRVLNDEYQALLEQLKCSERKRCNLEKLYMEVNNENKALLESKANYEREICELKTQSLLLKDKLTSKGEVSKNSEERKMCDIIKELIGKIKTLEKNIIPDLQLEINEKTCCIENLRIELREANISNQKMRSEALRVIQHTRKYLAAQRCANETLKTRLECSNKRGNMLGIENRELEDQLKAVTRMNEFLLCQLESKTDGGEVEPRSFSPLPWGCSTVERDTSSSEYLAESGFQSMQPSPTNMDCNHDSQYDFKRINAQWNSLKKFKGSGSVEYPSCRNGIR